MGTTMASRQRTQKNRVAFSLVLELDKTFLYSRRSCFQLFWMLSNVGGFCFMSVFLINWLIQFAVQPIHISKLVEKMYK